MRAIAAAMIAIAACEQGAPDAGPHTFARATVAGELSSFEIAPAPRRGCVALASCASAGAQRAAIVDYAAQTVLVDEREGVPEPRHRDRAIRISPAQLRALAALCDAARREAPHGAMAPAFGALSLVAAFDGDDAFATSGTRFGAYGEVGVPAWRPAADAVVRALETLGAE